MTVQTSHVDLTRETLTGNALARTVLLLRDHIPRSTPNSVVVDALTAVRVVLAGDRENLASPNAQHALATAALLVARSGAQVRLEIPDDVPLLGPQAPLRGERFGPALSLALQDLIPRPFRESPISRGIVDAAILIGDTRWRGRAHRILRLQADAWAGSIADSGTGSRWGAPDSPFGALASAGLAAGEVFKAAVRPLRRHAADPVEFDLIFTPTTSALVRLAPADTALPNASLGRFDLVSGGAIIQAALYALCRIPGVRGRARVIEPERGDVTNLNRYALLLHSRLKAFKALDLAAWSTSGALGGITIEPIVARYDDALVPEVAPLAPAVLVGVDDIPSRWAVQAARPSWLGIGATTHYSSMASFHTSETACAQCLHPHDDPNNEAIPTAAFVSHWAGLWLASMFARAQTILTIPMDQQSIFMTSLRSESKASVWFSPVPRRVGCPNRCG